MKQKRLISILAAVILIVSLTTGCRKEESIDQPTEITPGPLNITVSLNAQLSVSSMVTSSGGTLTAQGADGTKYTLTFPKGALIKDEEIIITPITSITGLHFSGAFVGGVQMAPEGLRLLKAAILTIESPKVVASAGFETVAFGYEKNGEGVFLNLPEIKGNAISMEIWHFSGGVAAQATPAEVQTHYNQYIPSNEENAFYQRMSEYIGRQRQAQILGLPENPDLWTTIEKMAREAYDKFVAPLLPVALNDCAKAPAILSRALGCARQMALMGWNETIFADEYLKIMQTYEQVLFKCHGWKTINPGFCSTAPYSCKSPFGPWDFSCDRPYQEGGTMSTSLYIPWSSDGKSRVTKTVRIFWPAAVTKASMTDITVYDITILKENESYFIIFKVIESKTIVCGEEGDCETIIKQPTGSTVKIEIVPANPGECG